MSDLGSTFVNGELNLSGRLGGMSTRAPVMYDDFDAADGTILHGRVCPTGQTWFVSVQGTGGQPARINSGKMSATENVYCWLSSYGGPVTRMAATFSFLPLPGNNGDRTNATITLLATTLLGDLTRMFHTIITADGWVVQKTTTGPINLVGITGAAGTWNMPLTTDGSVYTAAVEFDYSAQTVTMRGPDGSVTTVMDTDIGGTNPTSISPPFPCYQIVTPDNPNPVTLNYGFNAYIHSVSVGPNLSDRLAASGLAAPAGAVAKLYGSGFTKVIPFSFTLAAANTWYRVATGATWKTALGGAGFNGLAVAGRVRFDAFDSGYNLNSWEFDMLTSTANTVNNPVMVNRTGMLANTASGSAIDQARLSNSGAGAVALDLHTYSGVTVPVTVTGVFEGYFTPVLPPTAGAVSLGGTPATLNFANG